MHRFQTIDLDSDFDPSHHDSVMSEIFNNDYYEGGNEHDRPAIDEDLNSEYDASRPICFIYSCLVVISKMFCTFCLVDFIEILFFSINIYWNIHKYIHGYMGKYIHIRTKFVSAL